MGTSQIDPVMEKVSQMSLLVVGIEVAGSAALHALYPTGSKQYVGSVLCPGAVAVLEQPIV